MELKKNPKYDVHRYRSLLFTVGLITSIAIVIMAFEWTTEVDLVLPRKPDPAFSELVYMVPVTEYRNTEVTPVKPLKIPIKIVEVQKEPDLPLVDFKISDSPSEEPMVVINSIVDAPVEVVTTDPIIYAEVMPEPINGYAGFYQLLRETVKYPRKAQQLDIQGKVFVEFVVDEEGNLGNLKVVKGIGSGCDEEAMRILKLTKWKPGKQRGVPVKVRMVQPIYFKLGRV